MKSLTDILAEFEALATIAEDQFETSLAAAVADLRAFSTENPAPAPTGATLTSITANFSDGTTQEFDPKA